MKKERSDIVCILDRSGSMYDLQKDTIGGYNSFIASQKEIDGNAFVTTILFDHEVKKIYDRRPIETIPLLTSKVYQVGGSTALLDAVGSSIHQMMLQQDLLEEKSNSIIFMIISDGYENASREYSYSVVKSLIDKRKEEGWEFIFLGARIDAKEEASKLGIDDDHSVNFKEDGQGVELAYEAAGRFVKATRLKQSQREWNKKVEADYQKRKGRN